MRKRKPKIFRYRITETKKNAEHSIHRGVLQWRLKLSCSTPFLMSKFDGFWQMTQRLRNCRKISDTKSRCVSYFSTVSYCFMQGCFVSMAFCICHTLFISFFTSPHRLYIHCLWHSCALLSGSGHFCAHGLPFFIPFWAGFLKWFYKIYNPAVEDVRAKNEWKNQKSRQGVSWFLNAEGVRRKFPIRTNFIKI